MAGDIPVAASVECAFTHLLLFLNANASREFKTTGQNYIQLAGRRRREHPESEGALTLPAPFHEGMSTGSRPIQGLLQVVTTVLMKTMVVLEGQPSAAPCLSLTAKPGGLCVVSLWSGKVRALQRSALGDV